jgi:hypothetical protein|tara:strand:+ start:888 stop:1097 length:210 start_codon:yes stop_codon:yes gene_type:complete
MTKDKLIHTQHLMNSVIEVYITADKEKVYQIKCLTRNRCRKYIFDINGYIDHKKIGYEKVKQELENLVN